MFRQKRAKPSPLACRMYTTEKHGGKIMEEIYDIGTLKDNPVALHHLAQLLDPLDIGANPNWDQKSECYQALLKVCNSLWANMPPVVVYDYRDPDDPKTWGKFGPPPPASSNSRQKHFSLYA